MKKPVRNVVVEYKNKRARKGNASLWGSLDLKSISRQLEVDMPQSHAEVSASSAGSEPLVNVTKNNATNELSVNVADEKFDDDQTTRRPFIFETAEPVQNSVDPDPITKPEIYRKAAGKNEGKSALNTKDAALPSIQKTENPSVAEKDISLELLFLERENASLKRELVAKLHLENEKLSEMLIKLKHRRA